MTHPLRARAMAATTPRRIASLKPCSRTPDPALPPPRAVPRLVPIWLGVIPYSRSAGGAHGDYGRDCLPGFAWARPCRTHGTLPTGQSFPASGSPPSPRVKACIFCRLPTVAVRPAMLTSATAPSGTSPHECPKKSGPLTVTSSRPTVRNGPGDDRRQDRPRAPRDPRGCTRSSGSATRQACLS